MKTNEIISEIFQQKYDSAEDYVEILEDECWRFIDAAQEPFGLFRGVNISGYQEWIEKKVRLEGRKPLNSSGELHDALNKAFVEKFGKPYRNSLFASGDPAISFGDTTYCIFPQREYTFCWSPDVTDLYTSWKHWKGTETDNSEQDRIESFVDHYVTNGKYRTTDLDAAMKSKCEIMIWCDAYYGIAAMSDTKIHAMKELMQLA